MALAIWAGTFNGEVQTAGINFFFFFLKFQFIQSLRFQRSFMIGQHAVRIQKCGEKVLFHILYSVFFSYIINFVVEAELNKYVKVNLLNKVDHTIGIVLCRCVDLLLGALDIGIHASVRILHMRSNIILKLSIPYFAQRACCEKRHTL